tara:strand:- start:4963 stop:6135 length:1173 start_codon:yes stop_codon:yes gene_type:complete
MKNKINYPLLENAFNRKDISIAKNVIDKQQLTMSFITKKFEKEFANYIGSKYAVMVNSGSSANLLSLFVAKYLYKLKNGDEVIIPSLCWSTSLWPIVQAGLKPVFVDINLNDYNASVSEIISKITNKTRMILLIHVLGTSLNILKLKSRIKNKKIIIIEDTCESLGAKFGKKYLGNFGEFGSFSFYYSHQITCGEGGMIVTNKKKNYDMLRVMRAHGWDRDLNKKNNKKFNFINMGFNLRPLEVSAAIASNQLKRLNKFKIQRHKNREKIIQNLKRHRRWDNQYHFVKTEKKLKPSWFGLPLLLTKKYLSRKKIIIENLNNKGIETRPIISGNFLNQKASKLYKFSASSEKFPNANYVEKAGFFIGLHTIPLDKKKLNLLTEELLRYKID